VRYPPHALEALAEAGVDYRGWLPNFDAPEVFARHRVTVHVPRRPYVRALPGIPTIRPFEALACGIPLVSAPWDDVEGLFTPGEDYLVAHNGDEMREHLARLLSDSDLRKQIADRALHTIHERHTCAHRVDELLALHRQVRAASSPARTLAFATAP
jgi:spore maturation protein CgeB